MVPTLDYFPAHAGTDSVSTAMAFADACVNSSAPLEKWPGLEAVEELRHDTMPKRRSVKHRRPTSEDGAGTTYRAKYADIP